MPLSPSSPSTPEPDLAAAARSDDDVRLRLALEASKAGTWQSEVALERILFDARSREILGMPPDGEVSFADFTACLHPADRDSLSAVFAEAIAPGGADVWDVQFRVVHADGRVVWVHGLGHVYRDTSGFAVRLVGLNIDVSERKQVEQALRDAQADLEDHTRQLEVRTAQLRRFATDLTLAEQRTRAHLSRTLHDGLQQLLFGASLRLEQAITQQRERGADDEDLRQLVLARNDIEEAVVGARSLAVELFPPALQAEDLTGALAWLSRWMHDRYGVIVEVDAASGVDALPIGQEMRGLVFDSVRELIFNAVKHAGVDTVRITVHTVEGGLHLRVIDRGTGLPPMRRHDDGGGPTGLGLRTIRERLTLLGGDLEIHSVPGAGTSVSIDIPARSLRSDADRAAGASVTD